MNGLGNFRNTFYPPAASAYAYQLVAPEILKLQFVTITCAGTSHHVLCVGLAAIMQSDLIRANVQRGSIHH